MSDPRDKPLRPDEVIVRVGANSVFLKTGQVYVWPVVETIWPASEKVGVPRQVALRWLDSPKDQKPGKTQQWIGLFEPGNPQPWVTYKTPPNDRAVFQKLQTTWRGLWFLRIRRQDTNDHHDFIVRDSFVQKTTLLTGDPPAGLGTMDLHTYAQHVYQDMLAAREAQVQHPLADEQKDKLRKHALDFAKITELFGGALPWDIGTRPEPAAPGWETIERSDHEEIVKLYLQNIALARGARNVVSQRGEAENAQQYNLIVELLKDARIVELTYRAYYNCYHAADMFTTEDVAGMKWESTLQVPTEESLTHLRLITDAGYEVPYPEHHPFQTSYYAIGHGRMALSQIQMRVRGLNEYVGKGQFFTTAFLVSKDGWVFELIHGQSGDGKGVLFAPVLHRHPTEGWRHPYSLVPWITIYMVEGVNDHASTTLGKLPTLEIREQQLYKKLEKKFGYKHPRPQPFYTVYLRDAVISEATDRFKRALIHREYDHRFDRREHQAIKIFRGPFPLEAKYKEWFEQHGYDLFTDQPLDAKNRALVVKKKQTPKRANEWMALKSFWRRETIVGDASLPYIPSTRKPTVGILADDSPLPNDQPPVDAKLPKLPESFLEQLAKKEKKNGNGGTPA